jgi:hypothetical protein
VRSAALGFWHRLNDEMNRRYPADKKAMNAPYRPPRLPQPDD